MASLSHLIHLCQTGQIGELGWSSLPRINGNSRRTWDDVGAEIQNNGLSKLLDDVWVKQPLVICSQHFFEISEEFLNAVRGCKTKRHLSYIFRKLNWMLKVGKQAKLSHPRVFQSHLPVIIDIE